MNELLTRFKQINLNIFLLTIILLPLIHSCKCSRDNQPAPGFVKEKASALPVIHIQRFEKDLFSLNVDSMNSGIAGLQKKYGEFLGIFNRVLRIGSLKDPHYIDNLKGFITDYYQTQNFNKVMQVYPDINWLAGEFQKAFSQYRGYFPKKRIPSIITYVSGWNNMIVTSDTILAVSLDMFLGRDCEFYSKLQLPKYQRYQMRKDYIVPLSMQEWANTEFSMKDSASNLLSNILYQGKVMYFVSNMLPEANDTLIFGFRPDQIKWCHNNEKQMWTYLLEKKILFSTNYELIMKFVGPAPFTVYFTNESPGRACVWLGYRIIQSYMKDNKDVSLSQLMAETDYQKILRKSNYRP